MALGGEHMSVVLPKDSQSSQPSLDQCFSTFYSDVPLQYPCLEKLISIVWVS